MTAAQRRPRDPQRPDRIVAAARQILREAGVGAVTHRTVAARSGVPLGSTTYYFNTIEDLLEQTLRAEIADFVARARTWFEARAEEDFATIATDFFLAENAREPGLAAEYELYLSALARPFLRPLALEWTDALVDLFATRVPRDRALAVATLLDGYNIRAVIQDRSPTGPQRRQILLEVAALVAVAVE